MAEESIMIKGFFCPHFSRTVNSNRSVQVLNGALIFRSFVIVIFNIAINRIKDVAFVLKFQAHRIFLQPLMASNVIKAGVSRYKFGKMK
jgi:hypothetical protein